VEITHSICCRQLHLIDIVYGIAMPQLGVDRKLPCQISHLFVDQRGGIDTVYNRLMDATPMVEVCHVKIHIVVLKLSY